MNGVSGQDLEEAFKFQASAVPKLLAMAVTEEALTEELKRCAIHNYISEENKIGLTNRLKDSLHQGRSNGGDDGIATVHKIGSFYKNTLEDIITKSNTPSDLHLITSLMDESSAVVQRQMENYDPSSAEWDIFFKGDERRVESWCQGGIEELVQLSRRTVVLDYSRFMNPDLLNEPEQKARKERVNRTITQSQQVVKKPKEMTTSTEDSRLETNMKAAFNVLISHTKNKKWLPYFEFVLNPSSFVQTTYNMYIVAFLVSEHYARLGIGTNDELFISPIKENLNKVNRAESIKSAQKHTVISLTPPEWTVLVKRLGIKKNLLPEFCPKETELDKEDLARYSQGVQFLKP